MRSLHDIKITDIKTGKQIKLFNLSKRNTKDCRKATILELFQWLSLHQTKHKNGCFYDLHALELRNNTINSDEGVGHSEQAIRKMLGLQLVTQGSKTSLDIEEYGFEGEVKEIQSNKTGGIIDIKLNRNARLVWNDCRKEVQKHVLFKTLNSVQLKAIEIGELSTGLIQTFPTELRILVKQHLKPSNSMKHEARIYCGGQECFLTIDKSDYDRAWIKPRVTMGGCIKYTLSRRFLVLKILETLKREDHEQRIHVTVKLIDRPALVINLNNVKFEHKPSNVFLEFKENNMSLKNVIETYKKLMISLNG